MAATDHFILEIEGHGGHAAKPHATIDPVLVGSAVVQALQSIVSRNVDPLHNAVVSVPTFNAGDAFKVIPQRARLTGTARSLDPLVRDLLERRMREECEKAGIKLNVLTAAKQTATTYCISSTVGNKTWYKGGPALAITTTAC